MTMMAAKLVILVWLGISCSPCFSDKTCQNNCCPNVSANKAIEDLKEQFMFLQRKIDGAQPYIGFHVALSKSQMTSSTIPFNYIKYNHGNGWSSSTHKFTAPVKGLYSFSLTIMNGHPIARAWAEIRREVSVIQRTWARSFGDVASASSVVLLQAGDSVYARRGGGVIDSNPIDYWTHFVGFLVQKVN